MATLPAANLNDPRSMYLARFINCLKTTTVLLVDFGKAKMIGAMGLINVNFSALGKYRLIGYSTAGYSSPVYTSAWIKAWPDNAIPMAMRNWRDKNFWTGCASEETRAGIQNTVTLVLPTKLSLRWWRIEFDDETNPDGYLHIGNVFMGDAWTLEDNFSWGDALSFNDESQAEFSLGGTKYGDKLPVTRTYKCAVGSMTDDEVNARLIDMLLVGGKTDEMLVIPDYDDVTNAFRRNFRCEFEALPSIVNENVHTRSAEFILREIL